MIPLDAGIRIRERSLSSKSEHQKARFACVPVPLYQIKEVYFVASTDFSLLFFFPFLYKKQIMLVLKERLDGLDIKDIVKSRKILGEMSFLLSLICLIKEILSF